MFLMDGAKLRASVCPNSRTLRHKPNTLRQYGKKRLLGCYAARAQHRTGSIAAGRRLLNKVFKELLEKAIARSGTAVSIANDVRRVILQKFISTIPQLPEVAELLHVSPRTLQRRLKDEGVTFQGIVESVKSEMAIGMLKKPGLTVNEIAYKLGYMEPNVFRRAFKKWTGRSPREYGSDKSS
ncbi:MAG: AraC family transcriptional regulator [Haliscomenobacteraceae bacterium CHB4]|nr:AraC family transcriptional regulator [Haliscomenobacteraceae bacterium CHB4]